jgi:acetyl esterase/lipase
MRSFPRRSRTARPRSAGCARIGTAGDAGGFDVGEHLEIPSAVQAVCDYFGPTDFTQMNAHRPPGATFEHEGPDSPESRLVGGPVELDANAAKVQRANPIRYASSGDPPLLIVHGDHDMLVPHHQSELLYAALEDAGVPVHFVTVRGGGHGNGFPNRELNAAVLAFFEARLNRQAQPPAGGPHATRNIVDAAGG